MPWRPSTAKLPAQKVIKLPKLSKRTASHPWVMLWENAGEAWSTKMLSNNGFLLMFHDDEEWWAMTRGDTLESNMALAAAGIFQQTPSTTLHLPLVESQCLQIHSFFCFFRGQVAKQRFDPVTTSCCFVDSYAKLKSWDNCWWNFYGKSPRAVNF